MLSVPRYMIHGTKSTGQSLPGGVVSSAEDRLEVRIILDLLGQRLHRVFAQGELPQLGVHLADADGPFLEGIGQNMWRRKWLGCVLEDLIYLRSLAKMSIEATNIWKFCRSLEGH